MIRNGFPSDWKADSTTPPHQGEANRPIQVFSPLRLGQQPSFVDDALAELDQNQSCLHPGLKVLTEQMNMALNRNGFAVRTMIMRRYAIHQEERMIASQDEIALMGQQTGRFMIDRP